MFRSWSAAGCRNRQWRPFSAVDHGSHDQDWSTVMASQSATGSRRSPGAFQDEISENFSSLTRLDGRGSGSSQSGDDPSGSGGPNSDHPDRDEDPIVRRRRVEAVLLLAKNPLTPRKLAQMAGLSDATEARTMIRGLNELYAEMGRAMRIELIAGGFRMMTRSAIAPWISRLSHIPKPVRLSTPMMETLAIVAYRGPVSRASVEAVRGVMCGELLRQLMERDLVRIAGRSEELGRPYLYDTTRRFLQLFGLPNTDALPKIHWQALQDDSSSADSLDTDSSVIDSTPPIDPTITTKEPVVTNTLVSASTDFELSVPATSAAIGTDAAGTQTELAASSVADPSAVIEDEEDDLYEGIGLDDDDEEEEDGWDEDDWDDDDEDDDDDDDGDDLEEDSWEEVDDSDDDESDDDDDDEDDDSDEDWDGDEDDWDDDDVDDDEEEEDDEDWD